MLCGQEEIFTDLPGGNEALIVKEDWRKIHHLED